MLCPLSLPDSTRIKERSPGLRLPAVALYALQTLWVHIRDSGWFEPGQQDEIVVPAFHFFATNTAILLGGGCYHLQFATRLSTPSHTIPLFRAYESLVRFESHLQRHRISTYAPARSQAGQYMLSNSKKSACRRDGCGTSWRRDAVGSLTGRRSLIHLGGIDAGEALSPGLADGHHPRPIVYNHTLSADKSLVCAATTLAA